MTKKIFTICVYIFAAIGFFLTAGFFAIRFGFTNTNGIIDRQRETFLQGHFNANPVSGVEQSGTASSTSYWVTTPEWNTLREAVKKDAPLINEAARVSQVSPRIIVTQLIVEQLRYFNTDRESYKKFFEPLKILGSLTQFSWGVMGVKEDTAVQIENHLKDSKSSYYLGKSFEHILDFKTPDVQQERFLRMTDQHAHYYSYLYAGLYLKQVETQWKNAGFDISDKPEILTTLYNIGFAHSEPKADPASGGAEITINGNTTSFGSLGKEFYDSNELIEEFPR